MHVEIELDAHSRQATFRRTIHPMHVGDLDVVGKALDKAYREARDWLDREIARRYETEADQ